MRRIFSGIGNHVCIPHKERVAVAPRDPTSKLPRRDGTFGPHGARLAKYTAVVTSIGVEISLPAPSAQDQSHSSPSASHPPGCSGSAVEAFRPTTVDRPGIPADHPLIRSAFPRSRSSRSSSSSRWCRVCSRTTRRRRPPKRSHTASRPRPVSSPEFCSASGAHAPARITGERATRRERSAPRAGHR